MPDARDPNFTECEYPSCCCPRHGRCWIAERDELVKDQCARLRMMYQFDAANLIEVLVMEAASWKKQFDSAAAAASEYSERWEDKREQQTANAVDSAPSDCTTAAHLKADKIMTREEYFAVPLYHWHGVCWDYDGSGSVGIKYDGRSPPPRAPGQ